MKKMILGIFLLTGILSFTRFIEECEITSVGTYKNGKGYVNCISLQSGKHFNFINVSYMDRRYMYKGEVYRMHFEGQGYKNLNLTEFYYLY